MAEVTDVDIVGGIPTGGTGTVPTLSKTNTVIGAVNETAPASDTASSGLNGRLQRIAQRITTLIGSAIAITLAANAQKWKAGASAGWASAFGTEVNSVASGSSILSSVVVSNSTGLDQYIDISVSLGSITSGAGAPYVGFYAYPLNQDGTTYGDGRYGSAAATQPLSNYFLGAIGLIPSVTQVQTGMVTGIILPPGDFKLVLYNLAGATLAGSANTIKYRTYNTALQ